jgi:multiple sugar transport system substrate-binding protein
MSRDVSIERRALLRLAGVGTMASIAGCSGGGGGDTGTGDGDGGGDTSTSGGGDTSTSGGGSTSTSGGGGGGGTSTGGGGFSSTAQALGLGENVEARRIATADDWPMEARQDTPDQQNDTTWTNSGAFQSVVENDIWKPPEGWDDTAAGDVDTLTILNHGAASMEFDPATLAAHELFTEQTGIAIDVIGIGVDQATQREQQVLSSGEGSPQVFNVNGALVPEFVQQGYLETTDVLYPEGSFEPYIPALSNLVSWELDPNYDGSRTYGYPNIAEASLGHARLDLLEEQGIDPSLLTSGEWTWDDLEDVMAAFEGTDVFGYAYYAGNAIYLSYSFRELLYQQGARMVQDDGTVKVDTDAAIRVVQKMKEWRDNGWVPSDVISYGEGNIVDLFISGQLAFTTGFSDFVPQAVAEYGADGSSYRPVVPPAANAGPSPTQAGLVDPNTTSVNRFADTGHKLAGMLYGDLKLSYPVQWWEFTYEGNMSYMSSVYSDAADAEFAPYAGVLGTAIENGVFEVFPGISAVFQQMTSPIQRALQGQVSPADAMGQVQSFVDSEIN